MIQKVVVPVAGKGTRLMPLTSAVPKALFPLMDRSKRIKAVLHVLLDEVRDAGINDTCIIVSPGQKEVISRYLDVALNSNEASLPSRISFIEQREPRGFGDAVLQAKSFAGKEPFVLLLGDHVRLSNSGHPSCISQVVDAFRKTEPHAMIGVHDVDEAVVHTMGVAAGIPVTERAYHCTEFVEKPDRETARQRLCTIGLPDGRYLAHCGIYLFDSKIFDYLQEEQLKMEESAGELELAAAQLRLLQSFPESYFLYRIDGKAYDMGNPEEYLRAFTAIAGTDDEEL